MMSAPTEPVELKKKNLQLKRLWTITIFVLFVFIHAYISALVPQCKLIVCQMSNTRCQPLTWLLLPMALVVALAVTGVVSNEVLLLYLWTAAVILAHIHYGVSVVSVRAHAHYCLN